MEFGLRRNYCFTSQTQSIWNETRESLEFVAHMEDYQTCMRWLENKLKNFQAHPRDLRRLGSRDKALFKWKLKIYHAVKYLLLERYF